MNDMTESKMKPRLRAEELTGMISLLRDNVATEGGNSTNDRNVKTTRFKYRVDLIKEIHVTGKGGTKIVSREFDWDDI